jgi:hypothetical protein
MRTFALSLLLILPLALGAACTTEEGVTPGCVQNADPDGITPNQDDCHQFAACTKPDLPQGGPASGCCGANPANMIDCAIVLCRFGYGVPKDAFRPDERGCLTGDVGGGGRGGGGVGGGGVGGGGGSP